jgi:radical SAM protein with 4Fe4S-binding SPASM domain
MKLQQEFPLFEVVASYDVDNSQRLFAKKPFDALSKVDMQELEKCKHNLILHKTISGGERDLYADLMGLHKIYQEHGIIYSLNFVKTPLKFVKGDMVEEAFTKYIKMVFEDAIYDRPKAYIPKFLMHHMSRYVSRELGKMQPGCGISGELFLNGDGVFSPCSISNHQIDFPVIAEGKFLDTFEEATNLEQNYFNNPTCEPCPVKGFCAGGCLIARHMEHKDFNKPNLSHCTLITALFNAYNTVLGGLTQYEYNKLLVVCGAKMAGYHQYCYDTQVHKDIYDTLDMKVEKENAILAS